MEMRVDLKKLLGLRPKSDSAEAIGNAIAMAEAERAAALTRIMELEAGRGNLILTGDVQAMEAGERALASARAEAEQLGVLAAAMKPQLEAAKLREKTAEITEAAKVAEQSAQRFLGWWREQYPTLVDQMLAGAKMEREAVQAIATLQDMRTKHPAAFAASQVAIPVKPREQLWPGGLGNSVSDVILGGLQLPSDNSGAPYWPRQVGSPSLPASQPKSHSVFVG
jgi:hypothetical protein